MFGRDGLCLLSRNWLCLLGSMCQCEKAACTLQIVGCFLTQTSTPVLLGKAWYDMRIWQLVRLRISVESHQSSQIGQVCGGNVLAHFFLEHWQAFQRRSHSKSTHDKLEVSQPNKMSTFGKPDNEWRQLISEIFVMTGAATLGDGTSQKKDVEFLRLETIPWTDLSTYSPSYQLLPAGWQTMRTDWDLSVWSFLSVFRLENRSWGSWQSWTDMMPTDVADVSVFVWSLQNPCFTFGLPLSDIRFPMNLWRLAC